MCLMVIEHQYSQISMNGPEKALGAQEMINGAEMNWNNDTIIHCVSYTHWLSYLKAISL